MRKIQTLDGLRGYAILMVIYHHLPHILGWTIFNRIPSLLRFGYLGVDLFFVLSGFLITRILIEEKKQNKFSFSVFYYKRALRIFPIYYLLLVLIGIFCTWKDFIPNALYVSNYYYSFNTYPHPLRHTWSLSVEEHFYLAWPLILYYFNLTKAKIIIKYWLPAIAIITAVLTVIFINEKTAAALIYRGTNYRILSLSLGGLLAFKENRITNFNPVYLFIIASALIIIYYFVEKPGIVNALLNLFILTIVSVLIFLFALNVENKRSFLRWLFANPVISFIGKISYGLYLYHFAFLYFFGITSNQVHNRYMNWHVMILPMLLTFVTASVSYYFVEKYFLSLKKRLSRG